MATTTQQRKRSSFNMKEKVMIKRQRSERTLVADRLENCLHLGNASPMIEVEKTHQKHTDESFFPENLNFKDSPVKESKLGIKRERWSDASHPEDDDCHLSEGVEDEVVSFSQATEDEVVTTSVKTCLESKKDVGKEGEDEPDGHLGNGFKEFIGKIAHEVEDAVEGVVDFVLPHHQHHQDQVDCHEGFSVHLPAHFHQFDSPCPFGVRLNRSENGYKLARVHTNTAAHHAGLRESDEVTHLNDIELKSLDSIGIQELFMRVETTFTLTILRKCEEGNKVHLKKTTIRVTISDGIVVEVIHSEIVWSRKPIHVSTSALSYVCQDGDGMSQTYLNKNGEEVTMGTSTDERAEFLLDFYAVLGSSLGQRCVIRHASTNQIYDAVQNRMKTVKNPFTPDQACLLDKIKRSSNHTYVFESVEQPGYYLIYLEPDISSGASSGTLKLSECMGPVSSIPSQGSFKIYDVKGSLRTRASRV